MPSRKERLTVTVDPQVIEAGNEAVAAGVTGSLSAWVNAALTERAARDRKLQALSAAIVDYEAQFGEITSEEIAARRRADREASTVVRGRRSTSKGRAGQPGKGAA